MDVMKQLSFAIIQSGNYVNVDDVQNKTQKTELKKKIYATGRWFSPGTPDSSTNKSDRHDIADILLKAALNTKPLPNCISYSHC
jgi:hypothetical protein